MIEQSSRQPDGNSPKEAPAENDWKQRLKDIFKIKRGKNEPSAPIVETPATIENKDEIIDTIVEQVVEEWNADFSATGQTSWSPIERALQRVQERGIEQTLHVKVDVDLKLTKAFEQYDRTHLPSSEAQAAIAEKIASNSNIQGLLDRARDYAPTVNTSFNSMDQIGRLRNSATDSVKDILIELEQEGHTDVRWTHVEDAIGAAFKQLSDTPPAQ